jgi:hypothetical protein
MSDIPQHYADLSCEVLAAIKKFRAAMHEKGKDLTGVTLTYTPTQPDGTGGLKIEVATMPLEMTISFEN